MDAVDCSNAEIENVLSLSSLLHSTADLQRSVNEPAVWPDWALFKVLAINFYYKSSPNI